MSKKIIKEQYMNSVITESYEQIPKTEGDPVIAKFNIRMTEENTKNKNGRVYPGEAWNQEKSFALGGDYITESGDLRQLKLLGNLDHPSDGNSEVLLDSAAITWHTAKRSVDENGNANWDGEVHVLDTPKGRIVNTFLQYAKKYGGGESIGVSSRAFGDTTLVESANGVYEQIIPETFELISFDFVYNPSVANANNPQLMESTNKNRVALLESISKLGEQDSDNKEVYENFIKDYVIKSSGEVVESVLDSAKKEYIDKLRDQENKLYNSIYRVENMTDDEFANTELGAKHSRTEMLNKLAVDYNKVSLEVKKLKQDKELETVDKEITENVIVENEKEEIDKDLDIDELEDDLKDKDGENEELEDENEDLEDENEELEDELEDDLDELEDEVEHEDESIGELIHQVKELRAIVEDLVDLFMPLDDLDIEFVDEEGLETETELETELGITDEELAELTDEDLEILLSLEGGML